MKKIITQTIFMCFGLICCMSYGQTGTLYKAPIGGTGNIVRYDAATGNHIAYSMSALGDNVFSLTDMNILIGVKVWNGLKVTDFEIIDGMVFFCGDNGAGSGFLGWFGINDLFYNGGAAYIDQTLVTLGLLTLDNIEVYHDTTGAIRIAGYGLHRTISTNHHLYRALEAVGTPATGMQYRTMDLWGPGPYADIADVSVTDHFVVYLSREMCQTCISHTGIGITLHPFPKYDMFGTAPFYYHCFQLTYISPLYYGSIVLINDDPSHEVMPKMVHSTGDKVAVCTYRRDLDDNNPIVPFPNIVLPPINTYIALYEFDLTTLIPSTNNAVPMTSRAMAQLYHGNIISIDGFEYEPQTHRYIVLHRHESSAGVLEHAVTTANYLGGVPAFFESSYQTAFNTSSMWMPTSMCLDGYLNYTVMGHDNSLGYIFWRNSAVAAAGNCDRVVQYLVSQLPLEDEKYYAWNVKPETWEPLVFVPLGTDLGVYPCEIICN